jgi:hypothetical protein
MLGRRRQRKSMTGKNGRTLFDRPKPTTGCRANEEEEKEEEDDDILPERGHDNLRPNSYLATIHDDLSIRFDVIICDVFSLTI